MNIYVGNLSYQTNEDDLRHAFEAYGRVTNVTIIKDRESGESRGFGFVEMESNDEAQQALTGLNGKELNGRNLNISQARARTENQNRGGGGFRGRSRGGYRENW